MKTTLTTAAFCVMLAGCGGGAAASAALPPAAAPAPTPAPHLTTLGDSITWGGEASDRTKTSYAALLAQKLGAPLTNLGIIGETAIPEPNAFFTGTTTNGGAYGPHGGVLADEVGQIPLDTTIVTLWIGTNDLWMSESDVKPDLSNLSDMNGIFAQVKKAFADNITATIAAVHARVPLARIVVATNINPADKGGLGQLKMPDYLTYRQGLTDLTNAMNAAIEAQGATVVDLHCDAEMYDLANYPNQWDVHPNDAGHARIADDFYQAITQGGQAQSCAYSSVMGS